MFPDRDRFKPPKQPSYYTQYEEVQLAGTTTLRSKLNADLELQANRTTFLCIWYDNPENEELIWIHSRKMGVHHFMN